MTKPVQCQYCGNEFPASRPVCPHCGRPSLFPNVTAANDPEEVAALDARYADAKSQAQRRGASSALDEFERAAGTTRAVAARSAADLLRLANSDREVYSTYYDLARSGIRIPEGGKWDVLRSVADNIFFPGYHEQIRFAALSLDAAGLPSYGECSIAFRESMIAHRASLFEENTVLFVGRQKIPMSGAVDLPKGYRAVWDTRAKLCVAKLDAAIDSTTRPDRYPELLMRPGATTGDDDFVEVHIYGPMTCRTMEQVTIKRRKRAPSRSIIKALSEGFVKVGVIVEVKG
jgi:hypothetical protein